MSTLRVVSFAFATTLLTACAAPAPRHAPQGPAANDNLNAVAWAQATIEHDLVYREVYRHASEKLLTALADPQWDALPSEDRGDASLQGLAPAVIVDIDETVLDNSPYQARLVRDNASYDTATWAAWCREQAARPLPGALEFARLATARGVTVFYISNRAQELDAPTLANLRAVGFPVPDNQTVFLGLGAVVEGCTQVGSEKGCRRQQVARTHRVLLQLGDQLGDFVDVARNTDEGRRAALAPYRDWVGERWFMLPNPTYGAWESALFGNDRRLPSAAQRERKIHSLRY
jgi:5'-nucleotidase (lipoprotein e(P4) family)